MKELEEAVKSLEEIAKKIEKGEIDNKAMLRKFESQAEGARSKRCKAQ